LSLGSDAAWLELQNANALGVGLVTSTAGRLSFNMAASGTVPNPIYLNHGNGLYMKNIGSGRVTLSGNLGGAGNIFDNFSGIGTGGGFLLTGSNNVRALVDNTTLWAGTNTAFGGAKVGFGDLGNSGKLYLMNGVTISQKLQDFQFNGSGPKSNLTFTVGTDQANAVASFSGQVELRIGNPPAGINTWNLEAAQGATVTFSGIVSQTSLINTSGDAVLNPVNKIGAGTVVFAANNTYGGPTTVSAGTLRIGNGGTAGTLGTGAVTNNATLAFDRSDTTYTNATPIAGTGTVTKIGTGTVTFSAANVYSGATLVSNGTLRLAATGSISNSSTITVVSGAVFDVSAVAGYAVLSNQTLAGQGVVTGAVRVANGGILAAGGTNAVGVLSFGNNVTLTPGAVLKVDFNATTNDVLNVAGTFAASNQVVVQVSNLDASGPERIMTLVTAAGGITGQDQLSTWTIQGFPLGTYNCRLSVVNNSLRLTVSRRGTAIAIY
jgi:fibronectin-binding autotransporter adhesin